MRHARNRAVQCDCPRHDEAGCPQPARFAISGYGAVVCESCAADLAPEVQRLLTLLEQVRLPPPSKKAGWTDAQLRRIADMALYGTPPPRGHKSGCRCVVCTRRGRPKKNPALALVGVGFGNPPRDPNDTIPHRCRRCGGVVCVACGRHWKLVYSRRYPRGKACETCTSRHKRTRCAYCCRRPGRIPRCKNPASTRQSTLSQIKSWPGYEKAFAAAKRFHSAEPTRAQVFEIDDGKPGVTRKVVAGLGEAPNIEYTVPMKQSNKYGYHWTHKMGEKGGRKPWWVLDPDTGIISAVGGTYKVTDWLHR